MNPDQESAGQLGTLDEEVSWRAVARACAANPVALLTPCHRVIRHDGDLGGYRWGLERKQALLSQEKNTQRSAAKRIPGGG